LLAEENGVKSTIPDKPIDLKNYTKLCDLRRKFQVLYKVEFQVSFIFMPLLLSTHPFVLRSASFSTLIQESSSLGRQYLVSQRKNKLVKEKCNDRRAEYGSTDE
jgi:hypothetical protein